MEQSELPGEVANHNSASPCVLHATIRGTIGFGLVSLAAFSIWALGGKWLESHFGEIGLYLACAVVFIAMSGLLLYPLMRGSGSLLHFYKVFMPAFLGYAIVWCVAWFALRFGLGEWLGSLLGSAAFVGVMSWQMRNARNFVLTTLIVFAMNSTGYFLGGKLMHWILAAG